jgi:hypothetical protein
MKNKNKNKERKVYLQGRMQLPVGAQVNIRRQHTTGT